MIDELLGKEIKLLPNYWYSVKMSVVGFLLAGFPFFMLYNDLVKSNQKSEEYVFIGCIVLIVIGVAMFLYSILRAVIPSVTMSDNTLKIKKVLKTQTIPMKTISAVEVLYKRGADTPIFGKTTVTIKTMSRTIKITSDEYMGVDKIGKNFNKEKRKWE